MAGSGCRRSHLSLDAPQSTDMKTLSAVIACSALVLLGGCASVPTAPSLMALPGTGKDFNDFRRDEAQCRQYSSQQVGGLADDPGVRSAVVGTAIGAVAGAAIGGRQGAGVGAGAGLLVGSAVGADSARSHNFGSQRQYDQAYIQCMYARGHKVPVSAEFARSLATPRVEPGASGNYPPPPPYAPPPSPPPDYVPPPPPPPPPLPSR